MVNQCNNCKDWYCENCDINDSCEQCNEPIHCKAEEYDGYSFCSKSCKKQFIREMEIDEEI